MNIYLLKERPSQERVEEMMTAMQTYIKLAVDIIRKIVAGGGLHRDGEALLLEDGSHQENNWGADWDPAAQQVRIEALINIRPRQNNRTMVIQDPDIRNRVEQIVRSFFEGVN